jgi:hypothetical protein
MSLGGYALACDDWSGCCYNVNGACDNVTAFCTILGSDCVPLYDIYLEGSSGGSGNSVPMPGDGFDTPDGYCSCTMSPDCAYFGLEYDAMPVGTPTDGPVVCCPEGLSCLDPYEVQRYLNGEIHQLNPIFNGGTGICFAPNPIVPMDEP